MFGSNYHSNYSRNQRINRKSLQSSILTLLYYKGFSVLRTMSIEETSELILQMCDKIGREKAKKKPFYSLQNGGERTVNNSDYAVEATKFGISKVTDWGFIGFSIDNLESVYGIPFHGDEHEEEEEHEGEHEEERIFSTTDSESFTIKGSYNVDGNLVNKVDFTYRESDYTLTEAHEEEEGHDDHGDEEEHAPTTFANEAVEYGAIFDISNDNADQKVVINIVDEDNSIVGEEAFMNPANNEEFTIGYYISKDLDLFNAKGVKKVENRWRIIIITYCIFKRPGKENICTRSYERKRWKNSKNYITRQWLLLCLWRWCENGI